nr:hypothetical protein ASF17_14490 [uncultured bacterium]AXL05816.1 hypothetical protein ASF17_14490 [uncultured bacterium]
MYTSAAFSLIVLPDRREPGVHGRRARLEVAGAPGTGLGDDRADVCACSSRMCTKFTDEAFCSGPRWNRFGKPSQ